MRANYELYGILQVTLSGGMFKSTIDPNVSVYFPVHAVDRPITITMQVHAVFRISFEANQTFGLAGFESATPLLFD